MNRWIDVNIDLPYPHKEVLMLNDQNKIEIGFIGWNKDRWYTRHIVEGWSTNVKYWMELPSIIK